jgi:hypothetical protein
MNLALALVYFLIGQTIVWFTTNAQFFSDWASRKAWLLTIISAPVTYLFIMGTKHCALHFDGMLWPGRFIGFAMGMVAFTMLTYWIMDEAINIKTIISLVLAVILVCIQIFWK